MMCCSVAVVNGAIGTASSFSNFILIRGCYFIDTFLVQQTATFEKFSRPHISEALNM
jgi:hypothetical protein